MFEFAIQLIPTIIVLGALIFVHELGHFLACRLARVGVEKFSIGFGPEILSWQGRETRYSISLIPFGGFVKPKGETAEEIQKRGVPDPSDYLSASRWNRFFILISGVAMNFVFGYLLFVSVFLAGRPILTSKIGGFMKGYPAETSGLQAGDEIVKVNGRSVSSWQDLTFKIMEHEGDSLEFTFKRNEAFQTLALKPQMDEGNDIFGQTKKRPRIGILPSNEFRTERYGLAKALLESAKLEWELVAITCKALWYLLTMRLSPRAISGPIGIISMGGSAAKMGIVSLLQFAAFISVSLGVVNLLPIPALDGGHLFFLAIEAVFRRPINLRIQERFTQFGFYLLMALMVLVVFNDLVNIGVLEKLKAFF